MNYLDSRRRYKIHFIDKNLRWIFLNCDEYDIDEPDSFIELVKRAKKNFSDKIIDLGNERYCIEGDELNLIFQWDTCFGIVVEYPDGISLEIAVQRLRLFVIKIIYRSACL